MGTVDTTVSAARCGHHRQPAPVAVYSRRMSASSCRNCGAQLSGPFCASCGQSAHDNHDTTLGHLFHELTHELLHVDGKIWRTVLALVIRPGQLTAEYWAGRRAAWIRPFRVFLIAAAVAYLAVPGIGPMNFDVFVRTDASGDRNVFIGTSAPPSAAPGTGVSDVPEADRHAYLEKIRKAYAPVRYAAVPLFAIASWTLMRRRQPYFANHVVLAAHFYSAWYTQSVLLSVLPWHGRAVAIAGLVGSVAYLFATLRTLFRQRVGWAVLSTLALWVVMLLLELVLAYTAGWWVTRLPS